MNKKGFTLIELLAVIVILAVIALIATPVVMNSINNAREGAARNAAFGVIKAVEHNIAVQMLNNEPVNLNAPITTVPNNLQGTSPNATPFNLTVQNGAVIGGEMVISGYGIRVCGDGSVRSSGNSTVPATTACN